MRRYNPVLTTIRQPIADMGNIAIDLAEKKAASGSVDHVVLDPRAAGAGLHRWAAGMTARTGARLPRVPGIRHVDHVAFTVPDLDQAVAFFVEALGAQELYRSTRGPDADFMPENFAVPADARLTLAMLRMPPNLNVELFEWSSSDRRTEHPRHSDAGGHHLCFVVEDVDQAVTVLRSIPGVRILGDTQGGRRRQPPRRRQPMDLLPHPMGTPDGDRRPLQGGRPPTTGRPHRLADSTPSGHQRQQ